MTTGSTLSGAEAARLLLTDVPAVVTLGELIRLRVREHVAAYNGRPAHRQQTMVEPVSAESQLNSRLAQLPRLDWEPEAERALASFGRNEFHVFVGDRQVEELDEELTLCEVDVVSFGRMFPMAGG